MTKFLALVRRGLPLLIAIWVVTSTQAIARELPPLGEKTIIYTYGPWGSGEVVTDIGTLMLKRLGYDVRLKLVDVGLARFGA